MANMNKVFEQDMKEFNEAVKENKSTTKLIQELAGLVSEKNNSSKTKIVSLSTGGGVRGEWFSIQIYDKSIMPTSIDGFGFHAKDVDFTDQLQAAIETVKAL